MPATPESLQPQTEMPLIQERAEEFPETIQAIQGAKVVQKNFKSQIKDDHGAPVIQTPPTQVITTVTPPSDQATLQKQAKGSTTSASTWLAAFWIRVIKKALHFGWKVMGGGTNAGN